MVVATNATGRVKMKVVDFRLDGSGDGRFVKLRLEGVVGERVELLFTPDLACTLSHDLSLGSAAAGLLRHGKTEFYSPKPSGKPQN